MPLPPPPPGPPPASRSQSLSRSMGLSPGEEPGHRAGTGMPTRRPPTTRPSLPPVPPTPAGWIDQDDPSQSTSATPRPGSLVCDGVGLGAVDHGTTATTDRTAEVAGSSGGTATQDHASRGIRERRSESRTRRGMSDREALSRAEPSNNPWADQLGQSEPVIPTNLVLDSVNAGLSRRSAVTKASPRSPRGPPPLDGRPRSMTVAGPAKPFGPVPPMLMSSRAEPGSSGRYSGPLVGTPPPWSTSPPDGRADHHQRPVSHLLHTANVDDAMQEPLTPSPAAATVAAAAAADGPFETRSAAEFAREASRRHQNFADKEAVATSDRERVQLFAEFIVAESRIRRGRYADAIDAMGSEVLELTRDLFRPYPENRPPPPPPSPPSPSSSSSARNGRPSPQSLNSVVHGAFNASPSAGGRPDSTWWNGYMPSLSPIPSMSASIVPDELSSRGRAPSRWWEASQTGSAAGDRSRGMERSKRESKYMGLPLRDWEDDSSSVNATPGPSGQTAEYPPEKVGWHDQVTPRSSDPRKLDVSRLVTLPPPYPRHYPAVNNHHPDLAGLRTVVRGLADVAAVVETKEAFASKRGELRAEAERRRQKRADEVRHMVDSGRMSYAEAAEAEQGEKQRRIEALKAELDAFQAEVLKPLQGLLSQRIVAATCSFDELRGQLTDLNPVEEGDEKAELLEKLTLMKWLFEGREQLHRELHDLSAEADERYHRFVEAPYKEDSRKRREVQAFFDREERDRRAQFENHALARLELFVDVVESTVTKGVEVQLSTFWDIAPPLVEVIQRVNVDKGVQADAEYEFSQQYLWEVLGHAEKSAYQFIESQINLLCLLHEVKSGVTKQACKVMVAERRLAAASEEGGGCGGGKAGAGGGGPTRRTRWTGTGSGMGTTASGKRPQVAATLDRPEKEARNGEERCQDDEDDDDGNDDDMADTLRAEEERLTADLKEKVRTVEKQWHEAMGQVVEPLKSRIRVWLQQHGGWEVCEEDD